MKVARMPRGWQSSGMLRTSAFACCLLIASCTSRSDDGAVVASVIGGVPVAADPSLGALDMSARVLLDATAQGLVRFDAAGQIEPGVAERWTVIDHGTSYIFRLREAEWSDGRPVTAADVARILQRQIGRGSRNALLPYLSAIDEVVEMTPEVIEIRLKRPRPDLLKLFAQPDLALFRVHSPGGSGPFRIVRSQGARTMLRPLSDPTRATDDEVTEPPAAANVNVIGERASRAIARFAARRSDLVLGGTFADWPLVLAAKIAPLDRRVDPAAGLFGLAFANRTGVLADVANRAAIARAIDRAGFVAAVPGEWSVASQLLPEQLDSAATPAVPAWTQPPSDSAPAPPAQIAASQEGHPGPLVLRVALPVGAGATILYGYVGSALLSLGIVPQRVALDAAADLRLVDAVAPYDSARWYLATACQPCGTEAGTAIEAARDAPTAEDRKSVV